MIHKCEIVTKNQFKNAERTKKDSKKNKKHGAKISNDFNFQQVSCGKLTIHL